jgi:hypothetical protein
MILVYQKVDYFKVFGIWRKITIHEADADSTEYY